MSIKKILKYLLYFILFTIVTILSYMTYDYNSTNYICRYVEDEEDYKNKLILAENNSTMLFKLALYNEVCLKNKKEAQKLLNKSKALEQNMSK